MEEARFHLKNEHQFQDIFRTDRMMANHMIIEELFIIIYN